MSTTRSATSLRRAVTSALVIGIIALHAQQAGAVSLSVQYACMGDYFRYCSKHDPDGPETRRCMDRNGHKLSKTCINALVAAGEVSRSEVEGRSSRKTARAR
ncbi:MAG: hypothetical protein RLZ98_1666 [Pseudomonadota bacterium]|jgi:hypothetical protein